MTSLVTYYVNYVVQIGTSTGIYISVKYCSLQSCIPLEILCLGPVVLLPIFSDPVKHALQTFLPDGKI